MIKLIYSSFSINYFASSLNNLEQLNVFFGTVSHPQSDMNFNLPKVHSIYRPIIIWMLMLSIILEVTCEYFETP